MKKTLPLEKIFLAGRFLITADIEVSPNVNRTFLIDTGAMKTAIDKRAAADLELPQRGVYMPRLFSVAAEPISGVLADVQWYGIKQEIIVADYAHFLVKDFHSVAGIIGTDFLGAWNAVIDLKREFLIIQL